MELENVKRSVTEQEKSVSGDRKSSKMTAEIRKEMKITREII